MKTIYDFSAMYQNACKIGRVVKMESPLTWENFLVGLPESERQYWRCSTCQRWFEEFGSLVVVDSYNNIELVFWQVTETTPLELRPVFEHLNAQLNDYLAAGGALVEYATNTAFLRKANTTGRVGVDQAGGFSHFFFEEGPFKMNRKGVSETNAIYANVRQLLAKLLGHSMVLERMGQVVTHLKLSPFAKAVKDANTVEGWLLNPLKRIRGGEGLSRVLQGMPDDQIGYLNGYNSSSISVVIGSFVAHGEQLESLTDQYYEMIDPENFRKTKREASEQALKNIAEKIRNECTDKALTLRFARIDEIDIQFPIKRRDIDAENKEKEAPARSLLATAENMLAERKEESTGDYWDPAPGQKPFDVSDAEPIGLRKFLKIVAEHMVPVNILVRDMLKVGAWMTHDQAPAENYPWRWYLREEPAGFGWTGVQSIFAFGLNPGWVSLVGVTRANYGGNEQLRKDLNKGQLQLVIDGDADYKHPLEANFTSSAPYLTEYLNKDYYEHHRALNDLGKKTPMEYNNEPLALGVVPTGSIFYARVKIAGLIRYYEVSYSDEIEDLTNL